MFFVAYFCIYCFSVMVHGRVSAYKSSLNESSVSFFVFLFHFFPLAILVFNVSCLLL